MMYKTKASFLLSTLTIQLSQKIQAASSFLADCIGTKVTMKMTVPRYLCCSTNSVVVAFMTCWPLTHTKICFDGEANHQWISRWASPNADFCSEQCKEYMGDGDGRQTWREPHGTAFSSQENGSLARKWNFFEPITTKCLGVSIDSTIQRRTCIHLMWNKKNDVKSGGKEVAECNV